MAEIMVVDDSTVVTNEVRSFFASEGYKVVTADDGVKGLQQLKTNPGIKLIFVDVNMPEMDGLTMVEKIRNEMNNNAVHILMLTTEHSSSMKQRAKASGVKGWIVKPFNGKAVLGAVKNLVN